MLNAREREAPREIQHQLSVEKPGFPAMHGRSSSDRDRPMYTTAVLVTTALFVLMLVGPNVLTEKEIHARMTSSPRRSWATPARSHARPLSTGDEFGGKPPPGTSSAAFRPPRRRPSPVAA
jgi:hypothetical protein